MNSSSRASAQASPERIKVSFEFFPPKNGDMESQLWESITRLAPFQPDFVSVTYGAGGSTKQPTLNTVARICRETQLAPAAHLTCVGSDKASVDAVAREGADWTLEDLTRHYLEKTPTRNRALDLLPLLREADEAQVVEALGKDAESVNARPAFHYRLPDSRIGEPDWSLLREWRRWCLVEQVASRPELLTHLSEAWIDYRDALTTLPGDWIRTVDEALSRAFGTEAPA